MRLGDCWLCCGFHYGVGCAARLDGEHFGAGGTLGISLFFFLFNPCSSLLVRESFLEALSVHEDRKWILFFRYYQTGNL